MSFRRAAAMSRLVYAVRMHRRPWLSAAFILLCACGNRPASTTPISEPVTSGGAAGATSAAAGDPEVVGDNPARPRARKPFAIHSSCPDVVTIVFGEDPKVQAAGRRTVATNSSTDGPRDAEGKQTVSLLDDKGEPIAKVHISRGMKQLEIGRSCRTLDAH
jgi:hypothetical protein